MWYIYNIKCKFQAILFLIPRLRHIWYVKRLKAFFDIVAMYRIYEILRNYFIIIR